MDELSTHHCSTSQGPEVRVQILNLMDIYDKKTTKTSGKYEYRLGSSEVTIVAHSSEEIKRVRVYVQRCPEAAVRTHDTTGTLSNQDLFALSLRMLTSSQSHKIDIHRMESLFMCLKHLSRNQFSSIGLKMSPHFTQTFYCKDLFSRTFRKKKRLLNICSVT